MKNTEIQQTQQKNYPIDQRTARFNQKREPSITGNNKELLSVLSFFVFFFGMIGFFITLNDLGTGLLISVISIIGGLLLLSRTA